MPQTGKRPEPPTAEERERIVSGPDPDRFYCPHPGCNRSFAELWRLKVHYRAPPDVRGSGKERGHGTELKFCPKCGKDLRPGKHHVGCSAGKSAPRQAAKRQRQQMSTTTESQPLTGTTGATDQTSGSWELAMRRQAVKMQQQMHASEADSTQRSKRADGCRVEAALAHHGMEAMGGIPGADHLLFPTAGAMASTNGAAFHPPPPQHFFQAAAAAAAGAPLPLVAPAAAPGLPPPPQQQQAHYAPQQHMQPAAALQQHVTAAAAEQQQQQAAPVMLLPQLDLPQHGVEEAPQRGASPSPLELFADPFGGTSGDAADCGVDGGSGMDHSSLLDDHDMLRIPSPPPLPADWDTGPRTNLLFDFDQFDVSKRQQTGGASAPLVTVTTAMNPVDMLNPSDDYIWQILFAGENDAVPKRVTAHLHHPPSATLSYLDEADPILDAILSDDMGLGDAQQGQPGAMTEQQQHQQPAQDGAPGQQQGQAAAAGGGGGDQQAAPMLPCLDAVFHPQDQQQQAAAVAAAATQATHDGGGGAIDPLLPSTVGGPAVGMVLPGGLHAQPPPPYRNGFGVHGGVELVPPLKVEGGANGFLL